MMNIDPQNPYGMKTCMDDLKAIVTGGEEIVQDFEKGDIQDIIAGVEEVDLHLERNDTGAVEKPL